MVSWMKRYVLFLSFLRIAKTNIVFSQWSVDYRSSRCLRKEQEEEKKTLLETNQRIGVMAAIEFRYVCVHVRSLSLLVLIICTEREREKERKKKNDEQEYTHSYCNIVHWTTTTYGRHPCVQRTSSCQKIVVV